VYNNLQQNNPHLLKKGLMKTQKTTSKRNGSCSTAHQFRWFTNIEHGLDFLRTHNSGHCRRTGKTFGKVIDNFVIEGDEACLMADANGDLKIIGAAGNHKHEKKVSDARGSITMFRTGTSEGTNGPTAFVMKGVKRRAGYTDAYLVQEGCAEGSTIAMTPNAIMTDEAWIEISKKVSSHC
jgi:cyclophilin family peptidyl-prolyl cis-trans isomerase